MSLSMQIKKWLYSVNGLLLRLIEEATVIEGLAEELHAGLEELHADLAGLEELHADLVEALHAYMDEHEHSLEGHGYSSLTVQLSVTFDVLRLSGGFIFHHLYTGQTLVIPKTLKDTFSISTSFARVLFTAEFLDVQAAHRERLHQSGCAPWKIKLSMARWYFDILWGAHIVARLENFWLPGRTNQKSDK